MPSASAGQTQYDPNVTVFFEAQSFVDKGGWVVFEWEKPVKINAFRVPSGQAGSGSPKTPITDFSLQQMVSMWLVDVHGSDVTDNESGDFG